MLSVLEPTECHVGQNSSSSSHALGRNAYHTYFVIIYDTYRHLRGRIDKAIVGGRIAVSARPIMRSTLAALLLLAVVVSSAPTGTLSEDNYEAMWQEFVKTHSKIYHPTEALGRYVSNSLHAKCRIHLAKLRPSSRTTSTSSWTITRTTRTPSDTLLE